MTTQLPKGKIIRRLGKMPKRIILSDLKLERKGFLSLYSFAVSGISHRMDMLCRGDAVVVLPFDYKKKVVYMIESPRLLQHFAASVLGQKGPQLVPGMSVSIAEGVDPFANLGDGRFPARLSVEIDARTVMALELPAGIIDDGETPEQAALRELLEETGIDADESRLTKVATRFTSSGCTTERVATFFVQVDGLKIGKPRGDGSETINVRQVPLSDAWDRVADGTIRSQSSALLFAELQNVFMHEEIEELRHAYQQCMLLLKKKYVVPESTLESAHKPKRQKRATMRKTGMRRKS